MSIGPVVAFPSQIGAERADASVASDPASVRPKPDTTEQSAPPILGTQPNQENPVPQKSPATYELPEDVVEVHLDSQVKNQIIVDYLDQAKNVILQIPSDEELGVERGIAQELEQAAKLRSTQAGAPAVSQGGKAHGD